MSTQHLEFPDVTISICSYCGGLRYIDHTLCPRCDGNGMVLKAKERPIGLSPLVAGVVGLVAAGAILWLGSILWQAVMR